MFSDEIAVNLHNEFDIKVSASLIRKIRFRMGMVLLFFIIVPPAKNPSDLDFFLIFYTILSIGNIEVFKLLIFDNLFL